MISSTAGYSGTPLAKKLGIKNGFKIHLIDPPEYYFNLFTDLPADIHIVDGNNSEKINFIHYFAIKSENLSPHLQMLRNKITPDGMIWVSWPKKSSKVKTDITEDIIRNTAISNGLVDIKVCAVDTVWSRLKLVIPVRDRK